jgi:peptidoglycan/xylan/chitin deacetylase (PgdA/CDA1 family)
MTESRTLFLMYHELEQPDRPLCQAEPGYVRYVSGADEFRAQMNFIKSQGWRGVSVGKAFDHPAGNIAITFDDGSETDLLCAAPALQALGFGATFYITAGFIGKRGYLSPMQLRELSDAGFEIGCHSMTHAYLTDLDDAGLRREIADPKTLLEQLISRPVEHFSCPGGRYDLRVAEAARLAGYRSVATSRIRANSPSSDPFALGRVAVMRGTSAAEFGHLCRQRNLWQLGLKAKLRESVKHVIGNSLYDRLRSAALRNSSKV